MVPMALIWVTRLFASGFGSSGNGAGLAQLHNMDICLFGFPELALAEDGGRVLAAGFRHDVNQTGCAPPLFMFYKSGC